MPRRWPLPARLARRVLELLPSGGPPPSATCRAPHVALRFSADGTVRACCVNDSFILGDTRTQSLREIWEGPRVAELAAALDAGDYGLGCTDCGVEKDAGARAHSPAAVFDRYPQPAQRSWPRRLELGLSNTCNLQCVMCDGELSSAIRTQREHRAPMPAAYGDRFFDQLREFLPHVEELELIGGEPFLARETQRVWDLLREVGASPRIHATTNGTVWNSRVEQAITDFSMGVTVSVDGASAATVESIRVGTDHARLLENIEHIRRTVRAAGGSFTLAYCLMTENWFELFDFLVQAEQTDTRVNVLPVMYPATHSLFCLPDNQFREIRAQMHATAGVRKHLDRNLAAWHGALARLDAHEHQIRSGAVAVELRSRQLDA